MTIVSVSIGEELLEALDSESENFSGRSEVVRLALHNFISERRSVEGIKGQAECVMVVIHSQHDEGAVTRIKHDFEDVIKTQIHNNLRHEKCLELFVLGGSARRIKDMYSKFQTSRKVDYVRIIVP